MAAFAESWRTFMMFEMALCSRLSFCISFWSDRYAMLNFCPSSAISRCASSMSHASPFPVAPPVPATLPVPPAPGIGVMEAFVDPTDWEAQGMERGTPFALSHRFFQTGPFRPGNLEKRAPGLVFTGSGTVPGVGVPMVLVSGQLAAERVEAMA